MDDFPVSIAAAEADNDKLDPDYISVFDTIESFTSRKLYESPLSFHPKHERRFGHIVGPVHLNGKKTFCGIKSCGRRHWHGYVITTTDGKETNIGQDCGKKHLDADYAKFLADRKRHDALYQRSLKVAQVIAMLEQIPGLVAQIEDIEGRHKAHLQLRMRLRGAVDKSVMADLSRRAKSRDPRITRIVSLSGRDAEAFYANPGNKGRPAIREDVTGELEGLEILSKRMATVLDTGVIPRLKELHNTPPSEAEDMSTKSLNIWSKVLGDLPSEIESARRLLDAGDRFFTPKNISLISRMGVGHTALDAMISSLEAPAIDG